MSVERLEPLSPDLQRLLASERQMVRANDNLRRRALTRASRMAAKAPATGRRGAMRALRARVRLLVALAAAAATATALAASVRSSTRAAQRVNRGAPPSTELQPAPEQPDTVPPPAQTEPPDPAPVLRPAPASVRQRQPGSAAPPSSSVRSDTAKSAYELELRLLEPAREALASRDFNRALSMLNEHRQRFPAGRLAEERDALRINALLGLGRGVQAREAATVFRKSYPHSALMPQLERALPALLSNAGAPPR